ncbi:hypothetical protein TRVA0_002S04698 [Trichomonascus vanleenenianus]|uniref:uncharacterized protein n=1 Tax=Trichomonascus vanleenenianus TaxID=2268995 RepID=UPI003ECAD973
MAIDRSASSTALGVTPAEDEGGLATTRQQRSNTDSGKSPASHFLTSMLSVAQNAASQLTGVPKFEPQWQEERVVATSDDDEAVEAEEEKHFPSVNDVRIEPIRSAISTLGQGELSLEALGLSPEKEAPSVVSEDGIQPGVVESPPAGDSRRRTMTVPERSEFTQGGTMAVPVMSRSKSRASSLISRHRARRRRSDESPPHEPHASAAHHAADQSRNGQPHMVRHNTGSESPPDTIDESSGNNGSAHGGRGHRHLTGFAYANKKRNKDFHRLFRSVTPDDYLLDDFSCALSKDILIQGRLYVSERHVCFNSNILGWVTNLVIGFDEIVTLEKKNTAGLFPNGIVIQTLHARHSFASFVARDSALEFLTSVWKQSSPHQMRPALNASGEALAEDESGESDQDSAVLDDESGSEAESDESGSLAGEDQESDVDMEYDGESLGSFGSSSDELESSTEEEKEASPKIENEKQAMADEATQTTTGEGGEGKWPFANLGPATHAPTDTGTNPEKDGEKPLATEIIPAPLGVVVNILFGSDTSWMKRFFTETQNNIDLNDFPAFSKNDEGKKARNYQYVKPLNGPVGPKQTRCICTDTIETWKLDEKAIIVTSTSTPDVPSGSSFVTKTRYALCWAPNNQTKLILSYWMDWSGKSWLKGAIERGTQDGQMQFAKELVAELNSTLSAAGGKAVRKPSKKPAKAKKPKKKKRAAVSAPSPVAAQGLLDWVKSTLNACYIPGVPIPLWSIMTLGLVVYYVLVSRGQRGRAVPSPSYSQQDYDRLSQMMMEEEYEVWKWIENRVLAVDERHKEEDIAKAYGRQELEESIRITEDRLNLLKQKLDY